MYIPSTNTSQQRVQPFSLALEESRDIKHDYDSARWLYVPPIYCDYSYLQFPMNLTASLALHMRRDCGHDPKYWTRKHRKRK